MSDEALHFARMLRRAVDQHRAVLARQCDRDLPLEVEVLLATDGKRATHAMGRTAQLRVRIAALQCARRHHERLARERRLHIEDRLQVLVFNDSESCRTAGGVDRFGDHGEE